MVVHMQPHVIPLCNNSDMQDYHAATGEANVHHFILSCAMHLKWENAGFSHTLRFMKTM